MRIRFPGLQSRFGGLYIFGLVFLAIAFVLRTALFIFAFSGADHSLWALAKMYAVGLFFDLVTYFYFIIPAALFLLFAPDRVLRWRVFRWLALAAYFAAIYALLFNVVSEWLFWDEFGVRYNFVAVDYLIYTREVIGNIGESYPVPAFLGAILAVAVPLWFFTRKLFLCFCESTSTLRRRLLPGLVFVAVPILSALFVDSSFSNVTRNHFTNQLAMNGLYSLVAAFRENIIDYNRFYLTVDDRAAFDRVRRLVQTDHAAFLAAAPPESITREIASPRPEENRNVIIVVVESLSAEFLGVFGDRHGLTPNLDALAAESLFFTNFYATGTRTDRGLEAVTLSLPPTPGRSLVKRPDNDHLFSLGPILKSRGYDLKFIYGGFGVFDNMNNFFSGNGFTPVDQLSFSKAEITFRTIWGVCDEDLYGKILSESDKSHDAGKPFCSLALTVSNHRPYTYPQKIDIPSGHSRNGAVKYTDYALGQFLAAAKTRPWFDNTIFLIVADHCARSAGKTEVPVENYHIPLFIHAPKIIPPARVDRLAGQIDVAPTLLALMGFSYQSKFFGRDLLEPGDGRAFVGNYQKVGLFEDGKLAILLPKKQSISYEVDKKRRQKECPADDELLRDTIAYYQSADYLLRHRLYTPAEKSPAPPRLLSRLTNPPD